MAKPHFLYTSNIPVILIAALMANIQLWARLLESWGRPILGTFVGNNPATGFVTWIYGPDIIREIFFGIKSASFNWITLAHAGVYALFMIGGSVIFSIF